MSKNLNNPQVPPRLPWCAQQISHPVDSSLVIKSSIENEIPDQHQHRSYVLQEVPETSAPRKSERYTNNGNDIFKEEIDKSNAQEYTEKKIDDTSNTQDAEIQLQQDQLKLQSAWGNWLGEVVDINWEGRHYECAWCKKELPKKIKGVRRDRKKRDRKLESIASVLRHAFNNHGSEIPENIRLALSKFNVLNKAIKRIPDEDFQGKRVTVECVGCRKTFSSYGSLISHERKAQHDSKLWAGKEQEEYKIKLNWQIKLVQSLKVAKVECE